MLSLHLQTIFAARGIEKPYSFLVKSGFTHFTAHNLVYGKTKTIQLRHVEKLCAVLNCTPNDLLVYTPNRNEILHDQHPLLALKKKNMDTSWHSTLKTVPLKDLEVIANAIKQVKGKKE